MSEEERYARKPEIDREKLKEVLLGGVRGENIRWGMKLREAVEVREGRLDLHFVGGEVVGGFDLVIGADGAWSKVRNLLTVKKPFYSGISSVEFWAEDADAKHPFVSEFVGKGSMFSFGEGRAIQSQRLGSSIIRTYGSLRKPESFIKDCGIDWTKPDAARKEFVERYFGDCGTDLHRLMLESNDVLVPRTLYMLPVGLRWEGRKGVTLLGDAAHLMTPFGGVGVNAAMCDALDLARGIVGLVEGRVSGLDVVVQEYEATIFPRGEKFAQKTMRGLKGHFSEGGNEHFVQRLREE